jgi:hypothetical protein
MGTHNIGSRQSPSPTSRATPGKSLDPARPPSGGARRCRGKEEEKPTASRDSAAVGEGGGPWGTAGSCTDVEEAAKSCTGEGGG